MDQPRNFALAKQFDNQIAAQAYLNQRKTEGWTLLSAPGSKLPKGVVCQCIIKGYRFIESSNTRETLVLYDIQANVNGVPVNDTVLAADTELLAVGTAKHVENFEDARKRLLNRFVVQVAPGISTAAGMPAGFATTGG